MPLVLDSSLYLMPTPAGAFNAASDPADNRLRRFINALLQQPVTPAASESGIVQWSGIDNTADALEFFWRIQELGWVQALESPRAAPEGKIESELARLLPCLTRGGQVLLADAHGYSLCIAGVSHEVAEELSALSADLASLHQRRRSSLNANLGLSGGAWGMLDASGQSQLGFWPMYAGRERFVLAVSGMPTFNRPEMVELVWVLHQRYAQQAAQ